MPAWEASWGWGVDPCVVWEGGQPWKLTKGSGFTKKMENEWHALRKDACGQEITWEQPWLGETRGAFEYHWFRIKPRDICSYFVLPVVKECFKSRLKCFFCWAGFSWLLIRHTQPLIPKLCVHNSITISLGCCKIVFMSVSQSQWDTLRSIA